MFPLSGRLKISQSRNCPRPPSEIVPVPIPPKGKAIIFRFRPLKVRGKVMRLAPAACPAAATEEGCPACDARPLTCACHHALDAAGERPTRRHSLQEFTPLQLAVLLFRSHKTLPRRVSVPSLARGPQRQCYRRMETERQPTNGMKFDAGGYRRVCAFQTLRFLV